MSLSNTIQHVTTSPYHPQSNGLVKRMVQTVKKLISETDDPCLTILSYRATPYLGATSAHQSS